MKTRRTIKGTSEEGLVEEAYTPSNPPPYPVVTNGNYPNMTVGKATNADNATNATKATNIIPDSNGAVNPLGRKADSEVGVNSTAIGNNSTASGKYSTALGYGATVSGDYSTALGENSTASDSYSTALGYLAAAEGSKSTAIGENSTASGNYSTALGNATASGSSSTALGYGSTASGHNSTALGNGTASEGFSIALGNTAAALGESSTAVGNTAAASGSQSTALGSHSVASNEASLAIGHLAKASGNYSTALGLLTNALGGSSTALGYNAAVPSTDSNTMQLGSSSLSALRCAVALTRGSDKRDKTDIESITDALAFVERLTPVTFVRNDRVSYISDENKNSETYRKYGMCDYNRIAHALGTKKGERRRCGLLAQEVITAMQETYGTDNYADIVNDSFHDLQEKPSGVENKYTLAYENLVPFLIGAIKELNAEIKILKDKLNDNL